MEGINKKITESSLQKELAQERDFFIRKYVRKPNDYDLPPPSVRILTPKVFCSLTHSKDGTYDEYVVYNVGMTYVRSDPYTGMAMLYRYLYILGKQEKKRALVLYFPNITKEVWSKTAKNERRKDIRLYKKVADAILFADGLEWRGHF
jgi:hypothetical protein